MFSPFVLNLSSTFSRIIELMWLCRKQLAKIVSVKISLQMSWSEFEARLSSLTIGSNHKVLLKQGEQSEYANVLMQNRGIGFTMSSHQNLFVSGHWDTFESKIFEFWTLNIQNYSSLKTREMSKDLKALKTLKGLTESQPNGSTLSALFAYQWSICPKLWHKIKFYFSFLFIPLLKSEFLEKFCFKTLFDIRFEEMVFNERKLVSFCEAFDRSVASDASDALNAFRRLYSDRQITRLFICNQSLMSGIGPKADSSKHSTNKTF